MASSSTGGEHSDNRHIVSICRAGEAEGVVGPCPLPPGPASPTRERSGPLPGPPD